MRSQVFSREDERFDCTLDFCPTLDPAARSLTIPSQWG